MPQSHLDSSNPYFGFARKYWKFVSLALVALLATNSLEVSVPWLIGRGLDTLTQGKPFSEIRQLTLLIVGVTLFLSFFRFLWRVFWARFHQAVADDLRNELFYKYTDLSPSFFQKNKIGKLMSLITNDVNSFRVGIGPGFLILFDALIQTLLILPIMFSISMAWTWKCLILMPFTPFTIGIVMKWLNLAYNDRQEHFSQVSGAAQEIVSGVRVIKSFAQEDTQTHHFNQFSKVYERSCNRVSFWDSLFSPVMELPVALGCVVLLLVGVPDVLAGFVTIGAFFSFYQYVQRMVWPMTAFGISMSHLQEGLASYRRIKAVLTEVPDVQDEGGLEMEALETLEVKDLTFSYPGKSEPALKNISFRLERGRSMGIVGATGSGKTTLVELLCRLYPVEPGKILINGVSIEKIKLSSLRRMIRIVPQDAFLFSKTVSENMAFSRDEWNMDDVFGAAHQVSLHDEITGWPDQYESIVGERGVNLSGGQKQRMTLARALMKDSSLAILDDTLSAVDAKTEERILEVLKGQLQHTTAIVISHKLASVTWTDQILVLNHGEVERVGRHEELVTESPTYSQLYSMQASKEVRP
jgi:ATP-binding cassette subfamily B protein